ncbi:MAG: Helix-hairpin-helix motif protein [Syntrophus sp. PtaB.Bin001]|nr:MAG: Helix-hairpin-helix motif protein [Syntrophus sp. PtaB.Bin001]
MNEKVMGKIATLLGIFALALLLPLSTALAAPQVGVPGASAAAGLVNLNTATAAELEKLPGVGPAWAKKIIAGRPYTSVSELSSKAGMPAGTVQKISPLVTVGKETKTAPPAAVKTPAAPKAPAPAAVKAPTVPKAAAPAKVTAPPSGKGMVWANPDSKIYHKEGSFWYGKTKNGSYMTEAEAIKAGYRAPKQGSKEQ